jgi:hypothetical protein
MDPLLERHVQEVQADLVRVGATDIFVDHNEGDECARIQANVEVNGVQVELDKVILPSGRVL